MRISEKEYANIIKGAVNRASGQNFEKIIETACEFYRINEIAEIEKTPEPFRIERHLENGKFVGHFDKKAQPDFKGTVKGSHSVVFEAKHTDTGCLRQSAVTEAQSQALNRYAKMGAECFVLISFGFKQFFKIPWDIFCDMKKIYGRKYISPVDIKDYQLEFLNGILKFL